MSYAGSNPMEQNRKEFEKYKVYYFVGDAAARLLRDDRFVLRRPGTLIRPRAVVSVAHLLKMEIR